MAFVVSLQLQAQGPVNAGPVIQNLQSQLRNLNAQVNVQVSPGATRALQQLQAQMSAVTASARNLAQVGSAGGGLGGIARSASSAASSLQGVAGQTRQLAQQATQATNYMENLGTAAGVAAKRFEAFSIGAGSIMLAANALKSAVGEALAFERAMLKIDQVSNDTGTELKLIRDKIDSVATGMGVSSRELSGAALTLKQTGLGFKEVAGSLDVLAKASLAPNFDSMAQTVEGMIAVMRQFKTDTDGTAEAIGAMNAVAAGFAVEARDLVEVVRKTGGAFKQAGGDVNELIALFTSVRATTRESASEISTGLRTIFTRFQRGSTVEALKDLGINLRYTQQEAEALGKVDMTNQFVGAYEAVRRLSEGLASLRTTDPRYSAVIEQLGGYRQVSRVIPLIKEFGESQKALGTAQAGSVTLTSAAEKAQDNLLVKTTKLTEQYLLLTRTITDSKGFQNLAGSILSAAGAFGTLLEGVKPLLPMLTALAGIRLFTGLGGFAVNAGRAFGSGYGQRIAPTPVRFAQGGIVPGVGDTDSHETSLPAGSFVIRKSSARQIGYEKLASLANGRSRYASGGQVPVLLTPGEYVYTPDQVAQIGLPRLMAMNTGSQARFASGGQVQRLAGGGGTRPLYLSNRHIASMLVSTHGLNFTRIPTSSPVAPQVNRRNLPIFDHSLDIPEQDDAYQRVFSSLLEGGPEAVYNLAGSVPRRVLTGLAKVHSAGGAAVLRIPTRQVSAYRGLRGAFDLSHFHPQGTAYQANLMQGRVNRLLTSIEKTTGLDGFSSLASLGNPTPLSRQSQAYIDIARMQGHFVGAWDPFQSSLVTTFNPANRAGFFRRGNYDGNLLHEGLHLTDDYLGRTLGLLPGQMFTAGHASGALKGDHGPIPKFIKTASLLTRHSLAGKVDDDYLRYRLQPPELLSNSVQEAYYPKSIQFPVGSKALIGAVHTQLMPGLRDVVKVLSGLHQEGALKQYRSQGGAVQRLAAGDQPRLTPKQRITNEFIVATGATPPKTFTEVRIREALESFKASGALPRGVTKVDEAVVQKAREGSNNPIKSVVGDQQSAAQTKSLQGAERRSQADRARLSSLSTPPAPATPAASGGSEVTLTGEQLNKLFARVKGLGSATTPASLPTDSGQQVAPTPLSAQVGMQVTGGDINSLLARIKTLAAAAAAADQAAQQPAPVETVKPKRAARPAPTADQAALKAEEAARRQRAANQFIIETGFLPRKAARSSSIQDEVRHYREDRSIQSRRRPASEEDIQRARAAGGFNQQDEEDIKRAAAKAKENIQLVQARAGISKEEIREDQANNERARQQSLARERDYHNRLAAMPVKERDQVLSQLASGKRLEDIFDPQRSQTVDPVEAQQKKLGSKYGHIKGKRYRVEDANLFPRAPQESGLLGLGALPDRFSFHTPSYANLKANASHSLSHLSSIEAPPPGQQPYGRESERPYKGLESQEIRGKSLSRRNQRDLRQLTRLAPGAELGEGIIPFYAAGLKNPTGSADEQLAQARTFLQANPQRVNSAPPVSLAGPALQHTFAKLDSSRSNLVPLDQLQSHLGLADKAAFQGTINSFRQQGLLGLSAYEGGDKEIPKSLRQASLPDGDSGRLLAYASLKQPTPPASPTPIRPAPVLSRAAQQTAPVPVTDNLTTQAIAAAQAAKAGRQLDKQRPRSQRKSPFQVLAEVNGYGPSKEAIAYERERVGGPYSPALDPLVRQRQERLEKAPVLALQKRFLQESADRRLDFATPSSFQIEGQPDKRLAGLSYGAPAQLLQLAGIPKGYTGNIKYDSTGGADVSAGLYDDKNKPIHTLKRSITPGVLDDTARVTNLLQRVPEEHQGKGYEQRAFLTQVRGALSQKKPVNFYDAEGSSLGSSFTSDDPRLLQTASEQLKQLPRSPVLERRPAQLQSIEGERLRLPETAAAEARLLGGFGPSRTLADRFRFRFPDPKVGDQVEAGRYSPLPFFQPSTSQRLDQANLVKQLRGQNLYRSLGIEPTTAIPERGLARYVGGGKPFLTSDEQITQEASAFLNRNRPTAALPAPAPVIQAPPVVAPEPPRQGSASARERLLKGGSKNVKARGARSQTPPPVAATPEPQALPGGSYPIQLRSDLQPRPAQPARYLRPQPRFDDPVAREYFGSQSGSLPPDFAGHQVGRFAYAPRLEYRGQRPPIDPEAERASGQGGFVKELFRLGRSGFYPDAIEQARETRREAQRPIEQPSLQERLARFKEQRRLAAPTPPPAVEPQVVPEVVAPAPKLSLKERMQARARANTAAIDKPASQVTGQAGYTDATDLGIPPTPVAQGPISIAEARRQRAIRRRTLLEKASPGSKPGDFTRAFNEVGYSLGRIPFAPDDANLSVPYSEIGSLGLGRFAEARFRASVRGAGLTDEQLQKERLRYNLIDSPKGQQAIFTGLASAGGADVGLPLRSRIAYRDIATNVNTSEATIGNQLEDFRGADRKSELARIREVVTTKKLGDPALVDNNLSILKTRQTERVDRLGNAVLGRPVSIGISGPELPTQQRKSVDPERLTDAERTGLENVPGGTTRLKEIITASLVSSFPGARREADSVANTAMVKAAKQLSGQENDPDYAKNLTRHAINIARNDIAKDVGGKKASEPKVRDDGTIAPTQRTTQAVRNAGHLSALGKNGSPLTLEDKNSGAPVVEDTDSIRKYLKNELPHLNKVADIDRSGSKEAVKRRVVAAGFRGGYNELREYAEGLNLDKSKYQNVPLTKLLGNLAEKRNELREQYISRFGQDSYDSEVLKKPAVPPVPVAAAAKTPQEKALDVVRGVVPPEKKQEVVAPAPSLPKEAQSTTPAAPPGSFREAIEQSRPGWTVDEEGQVVRKTDKAPTTRRQAATGKTRKPATRKPRAGETWVDQQTPQEMLRFLEERFRKKDLPGLMGTAQRPQLEALGHKDADRLTELVMRQSYEQTSSATILDASGRPIGQTPVTVTSGGGGNRRPPNRPVAAPGSPDDNDPRLHSRFIISDEKFRRREAAEAAGNAVGARVQREAEEERLRQERLRRRGATEEDVRASGYDTGTFRRGAQPAQAYRFENGALTGLADSARKAGLSLTQFQELLARIYRMVDSTGGGRQALQNGGVQPIVRFAGGRGEVVGLKVSEEERAADAVRQQRSARQQRYDTLKQPVAGRPDLNSKQLGALQYSLEQGDLTPEARDFVRPLLLRAANRQTARRVNESSRFAGPDVSAPLGDRLVAQEKEHGRDLPFFRQQLSSAALGNGGPDAREDAQRRITGLLQSASGPSSKLTGVQYARLLKESQTAYFRQHEQTLQVSDSLRDFRPAPTTVVPAQPSGSGANRAISSLSAREATARLEQQQQDRRDERRQTSEALRQPVAGRPDLTRAQRGAIQQSLEQGDLTPEAREFIRPLLNRANSRMLGRRLNERYDTQTNRRNGTGDSAPRLVQEGDFAAAPPLGERLTALSNRRQRELDERAEQNALKGSAPLGERLPPRADATDFQSLRGRLGTALQGGALPAQEQLTTLLRSAQSASSTVTGVQFRRLLIEAQQGFRREYGRQLELPEDATRLGRRPVSTVPTSPAFPDGVSRVAGDQINNSILVRTSEQATAQRAEPPRVTPAQLAFVGPLSPTTARDAAEQRRRADNEIDLREGERQQRIARDRRGRRYEGEEAQRRGGERPQQRVVSRAANADITDPLEIRRRAVEALGATSDLAERQAILDSARGRLSPTEYRRLEGAAQRTGAIPPAAPTRPATPRPAGASAQAPEQVFLRNAARDGDGNVIPNRFARGGLIEELTTERVNNLTPRGRISEQTRAEVTASAAPRVERGIERELLSAQRRLLAAIYPNISSIERERIAREDVARALRGETSVSRRGRTILGTSEAVAAASNTEGIRVAPPGRFERFRNFLGGIGDGISTALGSSNRVSRGFNNAFSGVPQGFGTTALFTLPYVGAGISSLGGTAERAAAGGTEAQFKSAQAVGATVQAGAVGGLVGSSLGALIPAVGGGLGAVIGIVTAGLSALVGSLYESEEQIRAVKIGTALSSFADKVQTLAYQGTLAAPEVLQKAGEDLTVYRRESGERNREASTSVLGSLFGYGFNVNAFANLQGRTLRQDLGGQAYQLNTALTRQLEEITQKNPTRSNDELLEQLRGRGAGANRQIISTLAEIRSLPVRVIEQELKKSVETTRRGQKFERDGFQARQGEERNVGSFGRLLLSLQAASDGLFKLQTQSQLLGEALEGVAGVTRVSAQADNLTQLGRQDRGALQPLNIISQVGGEDGQRLAAVGGLADRLLNELPVILAQTASKSTGDQNAGDDFVTTVQKRLRERFGTGNESLAAINTVTRGLNDAQRERQLEGINRELQVDSTKFSEKLLAPFIEPLRDVGTRAARLIEENANRYIESLNRFQTELGRVNEAIGQRDQTRLTQQRLVNEIDAERGGRRRGNEGLSLEVQRRPEQLRLERLTGLAGAQASDPRLLGRRLAENNQAIQVAAGRQQAAFEGPQGARSEAFRAAALELVRLKDRSVGLQQALKLLADTATRTAGIQEKLGKLREDKDSRLSFGERYLSSDYGGRSEMTRGLLLANAANEAGSLDGFTPGNQRLIIETLRGLGNSKLTGFKGQPSAPDLLENLVSKTFGGVFQPDKDSKKTEAQLQTDLLQAFKTAEEAQTALIENQKTLNDSFFERSGQMQDAFFTRLEAMFAADRATSIKNRLNDAGVKQAAQGQQNEQRGTLQRLGITQDSQLGTAREAVDDIRQLATERQKLRDTFKRTSRARSEAGSILDGSVAGDGASKPDYSGARLGPSSILSFTGYGRDSINDSRFQADLVKQLRGQEYSPEDAASITRTFVERATKLGLQKEARGEDSSLKGNKDAVRKILEDVITEQGAASVSTSDAARKARDISGRLAQRGFPLPQLNEEIDREGGAEKVVKAIEAFDPVTNSLGGLNGRIAATTQELGLLNAQLQQVNGQLQGRAVAPAVPAAVPAGGNQQGGFPLKLASGGIVPAHAAAPVRFGASGTDTVPAMLTPGEVVVNAQSAAANLSLLRRINGSRGPVGLAQGGLAYLEGGDLPRPANYDEMPRLLQKGIDRARQLLRRQQNKELMGEYLGLIEEAKASDTNSGIVDMTRGRATRYEAVSRLLREDREMAGKLLAKDTRLYKQIVESVPELNNPEIVKVLREVAERKDTVLRKVYLKTNSRGRADRFYQPSDEESTITREQEKFFRAKRARGRVSAPEGRITSPAIEAPWVPTQPATQTVADLASATPELPVNVSNLDIARQRGVGIIEKVGPGKLTEQETAESIRRILRRYAGERSTDLRAVAEEIIASAPAAPKPGELGGANQLSVGRATRGYHLYRQLRSDGATVRLFLKQDTPYYKAVAKLLPDVTGDPRLMKRLLQLGNVLDVGIPKNKQLHDLSYRAYHNNSLEGVQALQQISADETVTATQEQLAALRAKSAPGRVVAPKDTSGFAVREPGAPERVVVETTRLKELPPDVAIGGGNKPGASVSGKYLTPAELEAGKQAQQATAEKVLRESAEEAAREAAKARPPRVIEHSRESSTAARRATVYRDLDLSVPDNLRQVRPLTENPRDLLYPRPFEPLRETRANRIAREAKEAAETAQAEAAHLAREARETPVARGGLSEATAKEFAPDLERAAEKVARLRQPARPLPVNPDVVQPLPLNPDGTRLATAAERAAVQNGVKPGFVGTRLATSAEMLALNATRQPSLAGRIVSGAVNLGRGLRTGALGYLADRVGFEAAIELRERFFGNRVRLREGEGAAFKEQTGNSLEGIQQLGSRFSIYGGVFSGLQSARDSNYIENTEHAYQQLADITPLSSYLIGSSLVDDSQGVLLGTTHGRGFNYALGQALAPFEGALFGSVDTAKQLVGGKSRSQLRDEQRARLRKDLQSGRSRNKTRRLELEQAIKEFKNLGERGQKYLDKADSPDGLIFDSWAEDSIKAFRDLSRQATENRLGWYERNPSQADESALPPGEQLSLATGLGLIDASSEYQEWQTVQRRHLGLKALAELPFRKQALEWGKDNGFQDLVGSVLPKTQSAVLGQPGFLTQIEALGQAYLRSRDTSRTEKQAQASYKELFDATYSADGVSRGLKDLIGKTGLERFALLGLEEERKALLESEVGVHPEALELQEKVRQIQLDFITRQLGEAKDLGSLEAATPGWAALYKRRALGAEKTAEQVETDKAGAYRRLMLGLYKPEQARRVRGGLDDAFLLSQVLGDEKSFLTGELPPTGQNADLLHGIRVRQAQLLEGAGLVNSPRPYQDLLNEEQSRSLTDLARRYLTPKLSSYAAVAEEGVDADHFQNLVEKIYPNSFTALRFEGVVREEAPGLAGGGPAHRLPDGRPVVFTPRGTDTVPAMLGKGEFVVNRQAAQANLPLLKAINNARGPAYFDNGGEVIDRELRFLADADPTSASGLVDLKRRRERQALRRRELADWEDQGANPGLLDNARRRLEGEERSSDSLQRQLDRSGLNTLRRRQLLAQSSNPLAAFGLGEADARGQTGLADRALLGRQNSRDLALRNDFFQQYLLEQKRKKAQAELRERFGDAIPLKPRGFQQGGLVPSYLAQGGMGVDTVPAWLQPGEFVLSRRAVEMMGVAQLERANRYAQGGLVRGDGAGRGATTPGLPGIGIKPEVLAAFQKLSDTLSDFGSTLNGFTSKMSSLTAAFGQFSGAASRLAEAMASWNGTLTITGTQRVDVVFSGAESLGKLTGDFQKLVEDMVREKIGKLFKRAMPEVQVDLETL